MGLLANPRIEWWGWKHAAVRVIWGGSWRRRDTRCDCGEGLPERHVNSVEPHLPKNNLMNTVKWLVLYSARARAPGVSPNFGHGLRGSGGDGLRPRGRRAVGDLIVGEP